MNVDKDHVQAWECSLLSASNGQDACVGESWPNDQDPKKGCGYDWRSVTATWLFPTGTAQGQWSWCGLLFLEETDEDSSEEHNLWNPMLGMFAHFSLEPNFLQFVHGRCERCL